MKLLSNNCFQIIAIKCFCFVFCCYVSLSLFSVLLFNFSHARCLLKTQNTIKILHKFLRNNLNVNNNNIVTEVAAHFLLGLVVVVFI